MAVADVTDADLLAARTAVHGLAEQVLAVAARAATGSIRLYWHDGALSTPELAGSRIELHADRLVRRPDGPDLALRGRLGELADRLGVGFGLTDPPYPAASGCGPEFVVDVDRAAIELILDAWRTGDAALRRLAPGQPPVIWPEHLDIAVTVDAVNFGVSPGDGYEPRPYAYVGPHLRRTGPFWNAPFGAARRLSELPGTDAVLAFFDTGRRTAAG